MTNLTLTDVLICGAGAAGLTLGIDLARRGVAFRLIEKMPTAFPGSRGKGLQPRTLEVFEDLGIIDRIAAVATHYPPQRHVMPDGTTRDSIEVECRAPTAAEPYGSMLLIPQFQTEAIMRERLAELGRAVEFGTELTGFEQDASGVTVHLVSKRGRECVKARYLIGADGARSFVRNKLGIGFPGNTLGVRAMVADVHLTGLTADAWHRFNEGSMARQISVCPLARTGLFQIQAPIPLEGDIDLAPPGLTKMLAARTGRNDIIVNAVRWASAFNMNARLAERYRVGRVFLTGDAAHTHPPTGGQGLNTSVQDAYNLGWKLAAVIAGAPDGLLDSYEQERRPIAAEMLGLALRLLDNAKRGDSRRGREVSQLDLGYPQSSLTLEQPARSGRLMPGDRAPDAPVTGAAGQPTRLFNMFQGIHWTVLTYHAQAAAGVPRRNIHIHAIGPDGDIHDDLGHIRNAYGLAAGDVVVVRPDGYIGAIVSFEKRHALKPYMANAGLIPAI